MRDTSTVLKWLTLSLLAYAARPQASARRVPAPVPLARPPSCRPPFNVEQMGIRSLSAAVRQKCLRSFGSAAHLAGATHLNCSFGTARTSLFLPAKALRAVWL